MNTILPVRFSIIFISLIVLICAACSSVPTTQYYTLVADDKIDITENQSRPKILKANDSIGIGPLVIPNSLENFSVISTENNNNMVINPYHLWAGNLKANINQVLADNISRSLSIDNVWAFPWDNRNRPKLQVRIVFEQFVGERGKSVTLQSKWTLLDDYGKKEIKTEKTVITESLQSTSYLEYVQALNKSLNKLSLLIAKEIEKL